MKRTLALEETFQLINALVEKVRHEKFSAVISIAEGGCHIGSQISQILQTPHHTVKISTYNDHDIKMCVPVIETPNFSVENYERCLVVDDLVDTGGTIALYKEHFGLREQDRVATLFWKPTSAYKPDFYVEETTDWIEFPWEF